MKDLKVLLINNHPLNRTPNTVNKSTKIITTLLQVDLHVCNMDFNKSNVTYWTGKGCIGWLNPLLAHFCTLYCKF